MKHSHGWMMWMSALVLSAGGAACGTTVSEPIEAEQHAVSPLATTLLVKDFSTSDATAWCSWYVHTLWWQSGSGPADLPVADGFTCPGAGGAMCDEAHVGAAGPDPLCASAISVAQCVQNLQRRPCEAPVAELDECVTSIVGEHGVGAVPSCNEHCSAFRARPSCDQTIVQNRANQPDGDPASDCYAWPEGNFTCRVPVD